MIRKEFRAIERAMQSIWPDTRAILLNNEILAIYTRLEPGQAAPEYTMLFTDANYGSPDDEVIDIFDANWPCTEFARQPQLLGGVAAWIRDDVQRGWDAYLTTIQTRVATAARSN